jgi:hypothetical protein
MSSVAPSQAPQLSQLANSFVSEASKAGKIKTPMSAGDLKELCNFIDSWIKQGTEGIENRTAAVQEAIGSANEFADLKARTYLNGEISKFIATNKDKWLGLVSLVKDMNLVTHVRAFVINEKNETEKLSTIAKNLKEFSSKARGNGCDLESMKAIAYDAFSRGKNINGFMEILNANSNLLTKDFIDRLAAEFETAAANQELETKVLDAAKDIKFAEHGIQDSKDALSDGVKKEINSFLDAKHENININFGKLSNAAKFHIAKIFEQGSAIKEARNNGTDLEKWLRTLVGPGNLSSIAATAIIGLIGGSLFGNPMMGLIVTGILNMLGNVNEKATVEVRKPAPAAKLDTATKQAA